MKLKLKLGVKVAAEVLLILACATVASGVTTLTFNPLYPRVDGTTFANCSTTDVANARQVKFRVNGLERYRADLDCSNGNAIEVLDLGMSARMSYVNGLMTFRWDRLVANDSGQTYSCEVWDCASAARYQSAGNTGLIVITLPSKVSIDPATITAAESVPLSTTIKCTADVGGPSGALRLLFNNTVALPMETATDAGVTTGTYLATETFTRNNTGSTYTCEAYNELDPLVLVRVQATVSVSYPPRQFSVTALGTRFVVSSTSTGYLVNVVGGSTGKVICAVDSVPLVPVNVSWTTDLTNIANPQPGTGSATIEILDYKDGKDFTVTCTTSGPTVISTPIQFVISRVSNDPGTGTATSGSDDTLWIVLGCVGGVFVLLLIILLVFCSVRTPTPKQKKVPAVPPGGQSHLVKEDPLTPTQGAILHSGAVDDEWQKEFMPEGMLENVAGNRKPIIDPMAQSMFEYLGESLLSLPYGQPQMQMQTQTQTPMDVAPDYYANQNVDHAGYQYDGDQQTY